MRLVDPLIAEMQQEAAATRRQLERVPAGKLGWQPHAKSMTLGQLALHVATIPGNVTGMLHTPGLTEPPNFQSPQPTSAAELLAACEASLKQGMETLGSWDDAHATGTWTFSIGGKTVMSGPRIALTRMIAMNHLYHHRGELQVYLRLLDVPLPSVYGPTADENPFM